MSDGYSCFDNLNNEFNDSNFSNPLERYMKNNHLSFRPEASQTLSKEKKSIKFNKHNSLPCSTNATPKNSKSKESNILKKENPPTKVSNKPPKYNNISNIPSFDIPKHSKCFNSKDKKDQKEKQVHNLKKDLSILSFDNSIIYKNDSIELSSCESDEDIKNESRDLKSLKDKINKLRKQLFDEIRESKEFLMMNDDGESGNEVELSLDDNSESSSVATDLSNIESINLSNRKFNSKPKKLEQKSFTNSNKKKSSINSLDLRTDDLIEKSENSLSDKMVSSDGLTSRSFTGSISSSCSTLLNDTEIHKPEFVLYLENKDKPSYEPMTGKPLKPENDILYQWRLRRKLEETKSTDEISKPILEPLTTTKDTSIHKIDRFSKHDTSKEIAEENEKEKSKKLQMSIQTQTLNMVDTEIQTEPEVKKKPEKIDNTKNVAKKEPKRDKSLEFEIPTKDCEENKKNEILKISTKPKFTSSSPIKKSTKTFQSEISYSNKMSTEEPVKIPVTIDKIQMKKSNSVPNKSRTSISQPSFERPSVTSSFTTTVSSICSSITNVTGRESPINLAASCLNQVTNEKYSESGKIVAKNQDSQMDKSQPSELNFVNLTNEYVTSFDDHEKELFESDDILRILLKKTYFYQLKLKQIDELITK
ncbi:hypothetical protein BpHYR1_026284 [Brachionus plicatilis]|uniref:Uncharacterized protein n=1 Tax=Brachionus plicatilis TaxID=10195 RepID=A0A3M7Q9M8_BRAPC|nr:hypothetical protein BpHYR1_026284 [Brachionus plicatilis]